MEPKRNPAGTFVPNSNQIVETDQNRVFDRIKLTTDIMLKDPRDMLQPA